MNGDKTGTKCAAVHCLTLQPQAHAVIRCRLYHVTAALNDTFGKQFDAVFTSRQRECHEFYSHVSHSFVCEFSWLASVDWHIGHNNDDDDDEQLLLLILLILLILLLILLPILLILLLILLIVLILVTCDILVSNILLLVYCGWVNNIIYRVLCIAANSCV